MIAILCLVANLQYFLESIILILIAGEVIEHDIMVHSAYEWVNRVCVMFFIIIIIDYYYNNINTIIIIRAMHLS